MQSLQEDPLNKLIIQMLLQGAVGDKPIRVDPDIDQNYSKGFGISPQPIEQIAPPYKHPSRQWPPQWQKWFGPAS